MLATAAENCRPAGDPDHAQRPPACEARFARAAVDKQLLLLGAGIAPRVAVRVHRAAAIGDRELERLAQGFVKPARRSLADRVRDPAWTQSRAVERLVRVDVAHAGDRALVEEDCFERAFALAQAAVQLVGAKVRIDGLRTEDRHLVRGEQRLFGAQQQTPKAARVAITQLTAVIEEENGVRVLREWNNLIDQPELPGHPEVHDQSQTPPILDSPDYPVFCAEVVLVRPDYPRVQPDEYVFPPPCHRFDPHPRHPVDELLRLRMANDGRKAQLAAFDRAADELRPQVGDDGFYFR